MSYNDLQEINVAVLLLNPLDLPLSFSPFVRLAFRHSCAGRHSSPFWPDSLLLTLMFFLQQSNMPITITLHFYSISTWHAADSAKDDCTGSFSELRRWVAANCPHFRTWTLRDLCGDDDCGWSQNRDPHLLCLHWLVNMRYPGKTKPELGPLQERTHKDPGPRLQNHKKTAIIFPKHI